MLSALSISIALCVFKVMMAEGKTQNAGKKDYEMVGRDREKLAC